MHPVTQRVYLKDIKHVKEPVFVYPKIDTNSVVYFKKLIRKGL